MYVGNMPESVYVYISKYVCRETFMIIYLCVWIYVCVCIYVCRQADMHESTCIYACM